jgi:MFS family permease
LIGLGVANHVVLAGSRVAVSLDALSQGANAATVGALLALYAVLPMFLAISAGRLADRIGVRRPMLAGSCGIALGAALPFIAPGLPSLFVTAVLIGVSFMAFQVATQYATGELGGPEARVRNFGLLALGYSTSSIAGPLVVGFVIDHFGFRATFAVLMLLPLVPVAVLAGTAGCRVRIPRTRRIRYRRADLITHVEPGACCHQRLFRCVGAHTISSRSTATRSACRHPGSD